jgi:membrane protein DedA with SNARE-associated domain
MLEHFLLKYGLFAVFFFSVVEGGDITLLLVGFIAHLGFFDVIHGIIVGAIGCVVGDCIWYWIGRKFSDWANEKPIYHRADSWIKRITSRIGMWEIVAARFVYGTRIASMIYWGTKKAMFPRFLAFDLLGCALWSTLLVSAGYFLTGSITMLLGKVRRIEIWLLIALICALVVFLIYRALTKRLLKTMTQE